MSIGASAGTVPFHVSVFLPSGSSVMVCAVPVHVHFSPSKDMFMDHVPSVFPVFLNVIWTVNICDGALSTIPSGAGMHVIDWSVELTAEKLKVTIKAIIASDRKASFFSIVFLSPLER